MAVMKDWVVVTSKMATKKIKITKKQKLNSIVWKSFYFIWPKAKWYALYVWYIIEDKWDMLYVWLLKQSTRQEMECEIRTSLITYDKKNDYKLNRAAYNSTYIHDTSLQD